MFNKIHIFKDFILCNVTYNIYFAFRKFIDFVMDPSVWKFFPFAIVDIIFNWLPLLVLIKFRWVCKEWSVLLEKLIFVSTFNRCANKEFRFIFLLVDIKHNFFFGSYLNDKGHISLFIFTFLHSRYKIQCTVGLMIVFSALGSSLHSKNYFIVNPFTNTFTNIRGLSFGEWGFFSLLEKFSPRKYDWVMLKHVCKNMESYFVISTSVDMVLRRMKPPFGGAIPPKEGIFHKGKFF